MRSHAGVLVAAALIVAATACTTTASTANPTRGHWTFSGLVLERTDSGRGPVACFAGITGSQPPVSCGGWPIKGWDWDTAPAAENQNNVRTSRAVLIGHVDGDAFVLDEPPAPRPPTDSGTYSCALIGTRDDQRIEPGLINARFDTPAARAAGVFPNSPHFFTVSSGGDPAVSGWIGLTLLADTPQARSFILTELDQLRTQICSVLRPAK